MNVTAYETTDAGSMLPASSLGDVALVRRSSTKVGLTIVEGGC